LDALIAEHFQGRLLAPLPPVHVSDLQGGLVFNADAKFRAFCVKFDPDDYRDA